MKKIAFLNVVCNGSTGKIVKEIARYSEKKGYKTCIFFGRGKKDSNYLCYKIDNKLSVLFHAIVARLGFNGHGSYFATKKLIKELKNYNPNIIYMHNIHGYYLNLKLLFKYLKEEYKGKIIWMLHDCWAFTGHCSYFTAINCNKWQKQCFSCPQLSMYPKEIFDTTKREYNLKKKLFSNVNNLTLVTPSNWLANLVSKSFLRDYKLKTIYNGINLDAFKPLQDTKIFEKYNIPKSKNVILGVANIWEERKGLNTFLEMSKMISKNDVIVLVGLNDNQINNLPQNIIGIKRTENVLELVKLYSIATVFMNPSVEETFSLVTIEALACGTPVIACNLSAPKELINEKVGIAVDNDIKEYYNAYKKILSKNLDKKYIADYAKKYSATNMNKKNIDLFKELS